MTGRIDVFGALIGATLLLPFFSVSSLAASSPVCVKAVADPVDTGIVNEPCESYVCAAAIIHGAMVQHPCRFNVSPEGNSLFVRVLWTPQLQSGAWSLEVKAFNLASSTWLFCPVWSGPAQPTVPLALTPCLLDGSGPWFVDTVYDAPFGFTEGTLEIWAGRPI